MRKYPKSPYSLSKTLKRTDNEYFGRYRGTVLDNEDPDERGRCKVFVYGIYDGSFNKDKGKKLPWAEPCQPLFCGGKGDAVTIDGGGCNGTFQCPDIGSTVWIFFDSGDITRPVMFGQTTDKNGKFSTEHCKVKWEDMYIDLNRDSKSKKNIITIYSKTDINETAKDNNINRDAGNNINDTAKCQINIETLTDDINIKSASNVNITAAQNINLNASSVVNIKAPTVNITGTTTIDGTCHITGQTTIDAMTTVKADASINGKSFTSHKHIGNMGAPTSPPI